MDMKRRRTPRSSAWATQSVLGGVGLMAITFLCLRFGLGLSSVGFAYVLLIAPLSLLASPVAAVILSIAAVACLNYFFAPPLFDLRVDSPDDVLAIAAFATMSLIITALATKLRNSAAAAQASQQALIDTIPALVWTALPDGSRDFHSRRWSEFTGISAAEAVGDGWVSGVHAEDRAYVLEKWRSAIATGEPFEVEARVRTVAGEYRELLTRAAPLRDEVGAIVKWCGVSTDIEDRRRTAEALRASEEQLQRTRAELARVSRVTTLGELTAAISHEVNQPIAATVANAQAALRWLECRPPDLDEGRQALARIVKDANRASAVINRIRALVRKSPPSKYRVAINDAISEVIELTRGEAAKNRVVVRTRLAESLPLIEGDRVQLQQVILNLIINAVEAMSETSEASRELLIETGRAEPDGVLVAVSDSGPGLTPEALERLFESFYTTKENGLGLGLSICRSIVESHGGRLWASANLPHGAILEFTVPAHPAHS
jgi:PAS domain S-box-containing protein